MMDVSKVINEAFTEATDHQSFKHKNKQLTTNAIKRAMCTLPESLQKSLLSPSQQSMQILFRFSHYNHD